MEGERVKEMENMVSECGRGGKPLGGNDMVRVFRDQFCGAVTGGDDVGTRVVGLMNCGK